MRTEFRILTGTVVGRAFGLLRVRWLSSQRHDGTDTSTIDRTTCHRRGRLAFAACVILP